jgi:hypothetical protein
VAAWVAFTWVAEQRKSSEDRRAEAEKQVEVRLFEARRPFIAQQLALYLETAQVAGKLVSMSDPKSSEWDKNFQRYEQLYWTELSMVEDDGVKEAMQFFAVLLRWINEHKPPVPGKENEELKQRAYRLARALRASIEMSWMIDFSKPSGS